MSWVFNGRAYETVGNTNSDFMIKTKGKIKIQWGDKFIDLVKDGKINTDSDFLNSVKDPESIGKTDGIYYAKSDGSLWVVIGGNKINLKGDVGNVYVSYMAPQDTTLEQKKQAQYNIGLVYKTMADAQAAGITSGFVYIEELKKLLISDGSGDLTEYQVKLPNPITEQLVIAKNDSNNGAIVIIGRGQSNSLNFNNDAQIYYQDNSLIIDSPGSSILLNNAVNIKEDLVEFMSLVKFDKDVTGNMFQSDGATADKGFRLFYKDEQSTLEVDNLIVRNGIELDEQLYPVKYYQEENVVADFINENGDGATLESDFILKLDHDFQGEANDYFCTFVTVDSRDIQGTAEINFKVKEFDPNNKHYIKINELSIITQDEKLKDYLSSTKTLPELIKNKHIYYMAGSRPVTRIENHNIDMLNVKTIEEESDSKNVNFRLGSIKELEVDVKGKKITDYLTDEEKILGIYSDNALFEDPQIIQPEIYVSENQDNIPDVNSVNTKIGDISKMSMKNGNISDYTNKNKGIYSDNAVIEESAFIKTKQYNTEFKNLDGTYPKYEENWMIPEESDDQTIATTKWVQTHIVPMKEDIKKNRTDIDINANEIQSLWSALNALGDEVGEVNITVEGNTTDISELESKVAELEELIKSLGNSNGDVNNPVVLASGYISTYQTSEWTSWNFNGSKKENLSITISRDEGVFTLNVSCSGKTPYLTSVVAQQDNCPEVPWTTGDSGSKNGRGSHWFATTCANQTARIREYHQYDDNNHSWRSGQWSEYHPTRISITIFGYLV